MCTACDPQVSKVLMKTCEDGVALAHKDQVSKKVGKRQICAGKWYVCVWVQAQPYKHVLDGNAHLPRGTDFTYVCSVLPSRFKSFFPLG